MKRTIFGFMILMLLLPFVAAEQPVPDGWIEIDVYEDTFANRLKAPLAVVPESAVYEPGETVYVDFQIPMPCTAYYSYVTVNGEDGVNYYYSDTSLKTSPCSSNLFFISFAAPGPEQEYSVDIRFYDGIGREICGDGSTATGSCSAPYDRGLFTVSVTEVCTDTGYCTDWSTVQAIENGIIEQMTCYIVDTDTCTQDAIQQERINCDSGYQLLNGVCVSESGDPVCGNGAPESGEECDFGFSNGVCPSTCSASCTLNDCSDSQIPVCGNGIVETGEQCDYGPSNGACSAVCGSQCTFNTCGGGTPPADTQTGYVWGAASIGVAMMLIAVIASVLFILWRKTK